ncbi:hypothetical protein DICVIV_07505 [Dictyocaulus viviparus]|uniref:Ribosomal RNA-processing protein 43 n=1 Tax=Dictyocaulus viviparus TaxID=29172 RepID=A0A0D8XVP7_DICVI|nr:hypothetical protein DICVIV_07505 [Dictyocaulus viviparus]
MGEDWFKSCLPMAYYDQFITEGIYPDGRSISAFTTLSFKLGAWGGVGSSLIRQGGAAVSCHVQASLALCHDGPLITHEVEACSSISQEEINDVISLLKKVFTSEVLSPHALAVKGTEDTIPMTWELTLKLQVLSSAGPITDVIICAVSAALLNTRLPAVKLTHDKDDESPITVEEILVSNEMTSLDMKKFPVAVTIYIFRTGKREMLLVDPPEEVIEYCAAKASVVTDGECVLAMSTRGPVTDDHLLLSVGTLAKQRHKSILEVIRGECIS